jgi:hypothetical protein
VGERVRNECKFRYNKIINKVMKELVSIQSELKAPKGQFNSFGKYKYRSCEDVLEALKPLLKENECFLNMSDEIVLIGNRYYIKATATITNNSGTSLSVSAFAREEESKKGMDASQLTGATSSYARKYALNGLFAIDDNKDADATNKGDEKKEESRNGQDLKDKLESLKVKIDNCKYADEVLSIWNENEDLKGVAAFAAMIKERGTELKNKSGESKYESK